MKDDYGYLEEEEQDTIYRNRWIGLGAEEWNKTKGVMGEHTVICVRESGVGVPPVLSW